MTSTVIRACVLVRDRECRGAVAPARLLVTERSATLAALRAGRTSAVQDATICEAVEALAGDRTGASRLAGGEFAIRNCERSWIIGSSKIFQSAVQQVGPTMALSR